MSDQYIYLFIRKDLSPQQQIIQTAHAAHLIGTKYPTSEIPNAVLIGAVDENHLFDIQDYLTDNGIDGEMFYEPDISQFTAIATYPLVGEKRDPLRGFSLM